MGVLQCDRKGCSNIMAERASDVYGYLCWECFEELVSLGPETNVARFMASPKQDVEAVNLEASRARFEVEFPRR